MVVVHESDNSHFGSTARAFQRKDIHIHVGDFLHDFGIVKADAYARGCLVRYLNPEIT